MEMRQGSNGFALKIKATYLDSCYYPTTAFPVSPEPMSNSFLFGIFFDYVLRTQAISGSSSKPLLILEAFSQQSPKQDPQHTHNRCSLLHAKLQAGGKTPSSSRALPAPQLSPHCLRATGCCFPARFGHCSNVAFQLQCENAPGRGCRHQGVTGQPGHRRQRAVL